jgi:L-ascorbate metabolism protein UlaG (beta-lactamase superfamily)
MLLTRSGHSCVRLAREDGTTLVIDPGAFSAPDAIDDANALLITHEHVDHFDEERVLAAAHQNPALRIYTNPSVAARLDQLGDRVHVVGHGDALTIEGFDVQVHGEWHAVIHPEIPRVRNVGFLIDGAVFHPGDALTIPERSIDTLLVPLHAPWSKMSEVIDYVREVRPARAVPIHDGYLNDTGRTIVDGLLGDRGPGIAADYVRLPLGESSAMR